LFLNNIQHIINVSSKESNFRLESYDRYFEHWYPRLDFQSPAQYVNQNYNEGDIIVIDGLPTSEYLKKPYLFYTSTEPIWFWEYSRKGGTEEVWTAHPLIFSEKYTVEALIKYVPSANNNCLWYITGIPWKNDNPDGPLEKAKKYHMDASMQYLSVDGRNSVWKINR
jgi:hypothetical protein